MFERVTHNIEKKENAVKLVLETTCIKRPPALRGHCSDTITVLNLSQISPGFYVSAVQVF